MTFLFEEYHYWFDFQKDPGLDAVQTAAKVVGGMRPQFNETTPQQLKDIIQKCWEVNPEDRPTFKELVALLEDIKLE